MKDYQDNAQTGSTGDSTDAAHTVESQSAGAPPNQRPPITDALDVLAGYEALANSLCTMLTRKMSLGFPITDAERELFARAKFLIAKSKEQKNEQH